MALRGLVCSLFLPISGFKWMFPWVQFKVNIQRDSRIFNKPCRVSPWVSSDKSKSDSNPNNGGCMESAFSRPSVKKNDQDVIILNRYLTTALALQCMFWPVKASFYACLHFMDIFYTQLHYLYHLNTPNKFATLKTTQHVRSENFGATNNQTHVSQDQGCLDIKYQY